MLTVRQAAMGDDWQSAPNPPSGSSSLPFLNSELYFNDKGYTHVVGVAERQVGFWDHDFQRNGFFETTPNEALLSGSDNSRVHLQYGKSTPKVFHDRDWSSKVDWSQIENDDAANTVLSSLASLDEDQKTIHETASYAWGNTGNVSAENGTKSSLQPIVKSSVSGVTSTRNPEGTKSNENFVPNDDNEESTDFSCSFAKRFAEKMNITDSLAPVDDSNGAAQEIKNASKERKDESEEEEAQDIDCILPDDEDLMAGMLELDAFHKKFDYAEDPDETDVFASGGGLELESDPPEKYSFGYRSSESLAIPVAPLPSVSSGQGSIGGEHPFGEHPSRTLFVRNINSNVEDSELRALFEQYGDIRTLYTACKHRGFVMISYYDIRSARGAMRALQNKPLRRRKLDIHFSIPKENPSDKDINQGTLVVFNLDSSVSNEDLRNIFGVYGEVKEIRETPHKKHHKFIEFYDVRAAEAALRALNRSDIAGKRIKLEPSRPGGARRSLIQQLSAELEQEEAKPLRQQPASSSPPGASQWSSLHPSIDPPLNSKPFLAGSLDSSLASNYMHANFANNVNQTSLSHKAQSFGVGSPSTLGLPPYSAASIRKFSSSSSLSNLQNHFDQSNLMNHQVFSSSLPSQNPPSADLTFPKGHFGAIGAGRSISENNSDTFANASFSNEGIYDPFYDSSGVPGQSSQRYISNSLNTKSNLSSSHIWSSHVFPSSLPSSPSPWSSSLDPLFPSRNQSSHHSLDHYSHSVSRSFGGNFSGYPHQSVYSKSFSPHIVGSDPQLLDRQYSFMGESPDPILNQCNSVVTGGGLGGFGSGNNLNTYAGILHSRDTGVDGYMVHGMSQNGFYDGVGFDAMNSASGGTIPSNSRGRMFAPSSLPSSVQFGSLEGFSERGRGKRSEAVYPDSKRQYALDIEKILQGEDTRTTLMIKNIPNKYTQKMLLSAIDENFRGTYDFFYLPIDFKNKCNVGYAFINMIDPIKIVPFYEAFNGKKWEKFNSEKVANLAYARIQGKFALIAHFQNSSLMNEDKRCRPVLFHTQGPLQGDQEPFPVGVNVRSRSSRDRLTSNLSEGNLCSPSNLSGSSSNNSRDDSGHNGSIFLFANSVAISTRSSQDYAGKTQDEDGLS